MSVLSESVGNEVESLRAQARVIVLDRLRRGVRGNAPGPGGPCPVFRRNSLLWSEETIRGIVDHEQRCREARPR